MLPSTDVDASTPSFVSALNNVIAKGANRRRSCLPAKVVTFNAANRTCDCELLITEEDGTKLALLKSVPVQYPRGGGFEITYPLSEGDEVLCFFADRDFERWLIDGRAGPPQSGRRNTLSDAFCVPGLRDFQDSNVAVGSGLRLQHNASGMTIRISTAGKVAIEKGGVELLDLIQQLVTALGSAVAGPNALTFPSDPTVIADITTSLATIKE